VRFKVEGTQTTENGEEAPFSLWLTATRASNSADLKALEDDIRKRREANSASAVTDVMVERIKGWSGVAAEDGTDVPFSEPACRTLLEMNGMAMLVYLTYLRESGARAKN
jgi:hypothetical protein